MFVPEWFLFLYFKYWYFRSLKRFWDCDFKLVNVLELHQSMINDINKRVLNWRFTLVLIKINYGQINRALLYNKPSILPVEIDLSVVPARLGIWFFHLSRRTGVIQDLLVRRQFSLVPDNRTNVNVEAWTFNYFFNVYSAHVLMLFCHLKHRSFVFKAKEGRHIRIRWYK